MARAEFRIRNLFAAGIHSLHVPIHEAFRDSDFNRPELLPVFRSRRNIRFIGRHLIAGSADTAAISVMAESAFRISLTGHSLLRSHCHSNPRSLHLESLGPVTDQSGQYHASGGRSHLDAVIADEP